MRHTNNPNGRGDSAALLETLGEILAVLLIFACGALLLAL
jgi:hypothetical protein